MYTIRSCRWHCSFVLAKLPNRIFFVNESLWGASATAADSSRHLGGQAPSPKSPCVWVVIEPSPVMIVVALALVCHIIRRRHVFVRNGLDLSAYLKGNLMVVLLYPQFLDAPMHARAWDGARFHPWTVQNDIKCNVCISGWWFGTFFIFHNIWYGIILPIDEYFSEGLKPLTRYVCNLLWVALRLQNGHQGHEVKSLQQDMRGKGNSKSHRPLSIAPWSWSCIDCR